MHTYGSEIDISFPSPPFGPQFDRKGPSRGPTRGFVTFNWLQRPAHRGPPGPNCEAFEPNLVPKVC